MKDLVNRYLQEVRFWLPRKQQDDIVQELSDDIQSQIEERRDALEREPDDAEIAEILKGHGSPFLVACRYRPDQEWISTPLLLLYRLVLKILLLWVLAPILAVIYIPAIFTSSNPARAILVSWGQIVQAVVFAVGAMTVGFAVVRWAKPDMFSPRDWDPLKLPPAMDRLKIPRFESFLGVLISLWFLSWWIDLPHRVARDFAAAVGSPVNPTLWLELRGVLYAPSIVVLVASIVLAGVNLAYPRWTRARIAARASIDGALALLCAVALALDWGELSRQLASISQAETHRQQGSIVVLNLGLAVTLAVVAIGTGISSALWFSKLRSKPAPPKPIAE